MTRVGLRIDVDTLRGTRRGVPRLLETLAKHGVTATFFFCVGPDNMGRHMWRLFDPRFAWKMLRSNAAGLYGWDIALAGTFWPGRSIARHCAREILAADNAGHEIGLHGWDHHRWQARADRMSVDQLRSQVALGVDALTDVLGHAPVCSAAPAWKCNDLVIEAKQSFDFVYNSDCRGQSIFVPVVDGFEGTVQVPTTLPTYDETIGRGGVTPDTYNGHLLDLVREDGLNVLTIHAEVEGIVCAELFDAFLAAGRARGIEFVPLGRLLEEGVEFERARVKSAPVPGRAGTVGWQQPLFAPAH